MLHPKEAESASFDCFLTKNRLTEEAESASFDSPARIGLKVRASDDRHASASWNSAIRCNDARSNNAWNCGVTHLVLLSFFRFFDSRHVSTPLLVLMCTLSPSMPVTTALRSFSGVQCCEWFVGLRILFVTTTRSPTLNVPNLLVPASIAADSLLVCLWLAASMSSMTSPSRKLSCLSSAIRSPIDSPCAMCRKKRREKKGEEERVARSF